MDEPVDGGEGHGLIGKDFSPLAEGLICRDEKGASFVAGADQLEENAGFGLILGDVGEVIKDEKVIFVELVDRRLEGEITPGELQLLDEVRRSGKENAPSVFDEPQAEGRREMRFSDAGWTEHQQIGALFQPRVAGGESLHLRLRDHRHGVEVEGIEGLSGRQARLGEMSGEAALPSIGEFLLSKRGEESCGGPAFLVGCGGKRAPDELDAGKAQFGEKEVDAGGVDFVVRLHAAAPSREASAS
jgi:hypothetical protein